MSHFFAISFTPRRLRSTRSTSSTASARSTILMVSVPFAFCSSNISVPDCSISVRLRFLWRFPIPLAVAAHSPCLNVRSLHYGIFIPVLNRTLLMSVIVMGCHLFYYYIVSYFSCQSSFFLPSMEELVVKIEKFVSNILRLNEKNGYTFGSIYDRIHIATVLRNYHSGFISNSSTVPLLRPNKSHPPLFDSVTFRRSKA